MATFDQLSAEQRAIIELVLKQNQQYEQLATMLGLPTSRVRELAREALVRLSPVSAAAVDDDWRGQLADYLLNQQTGPEATATKGHLRRSEAGRGWARSVLDSLEQFYDPASLPTIPAGEPAGAPGASASPAGTARPRRQGSPRSPGPTRTAATAPRGGRFPPKRATRSSAAGWPVVVGALALAAGGPLRAAARRPSPGSRATTTRIRSPRPRMPRTPSRASSGSSCCARRASRRPRPPAWR
ncbi:MAG: sigma factor-like helix-turn-helix DNA-binding protein [Thermoleophilaceae bacterium]